MRIIHGVVRLYAKSPPEQPGGFLKVFETFARLRLEFNTESFSLVISLDSDIYFTSVQSSIKVIRWGIVIPSDVWGTTAEIEFVKDFHHLNPLSYGDSLIMQAGFLPSIPLLQPLHGFQVTEPLLLSVARGGSTEKRALKIEEE